MYRKVDRSLLLFAWGLALASCYKLGFQDYAPSDAASRGAISANEAGDPGVDAPLPVTNSDSAGDVPGAGDGGTSGATLEVGGAGGQQEVIVGGRAGGFGGGTAGSGDIAGTGGARGTGGIAETDATTSADGSLGAEGPIAPTCNPSCPADFSCYDVSDSRCAATRLPAGDGRDTQQFAVSDDQLTVTDTITGLVWQRDGSDVRTGCSGSRQATCTWAEAMSYCEKLMVGDLGGWRLPTRMELITLLDLTKAYPGPTIDQGTFPNTPDGLGFWTSSQYAGSTSRAWNVSFMMGVSHDSYVGELNRVRCVR